MPYLEVKKTIQIILIIIDKVMIMAFFYIQK